MTLALNISDLQRLAAAAQRPALDAAIRELESEVARFHLSKLGGFDHQVKTFLKTEEQITRAQAAGHRVTWELRPGLNIDEVQQEWNTLQQMLDALILQRDDLL